MTVTIHLSPEQERQLSERATRSGQDLAGYIHRLIERDIRTPATLDEALASVRRQFQESGLTEEDLDALVEEAREEVWREKDPGHGRAR